MGFEKTNIPGLLKNVKTNVVINTNYKEYEIYKAALDKSKRIKSLEKEMSVLKEVITKISQKIDLK